MKALKKSWRLVPLAVLLWTSLNCGGKWVDDDRNFDRVFGFGKPPDVEVLHSYYWKSAHWSNEYRYFIALKASPKFTGGITSAAVVASAARWTEALNSCGGERPPWFLPKSPKNYEFWLPKSRGGYRIFRDKSEGTLYLCDEQM
jgi:hypothetical protein